MNILSFIKPSKFAPAERLQITDCQKQFDRILAEDIRLTIFDLFPDSIVILNSERQIVFANRAFLGFVKAKTMAEVVGKRQGEAFGCVHSQNETGGCGTSEFCRVCGGTHAVLSTINTRTQDRDDCEIEVANGHALNLRVWTFPFDKDQASFVLCVIKDIADEKYRASLEHIFFHDLTNIGSGMYGLLSIIGNNPENYLKYSNLLIGLSKQILDEIGAQRDLLDAENGTLALAMDTVDSVYMIKKVRDAYSCHQVAEGKSIILNEGVESLSLQTDARLLFRILGNMVKNALEASNPGDSVTIDCNRSGDNVRFFVANPGFMPKDVQLQIFRRAFSTKGKGRGLGTYSIRLLAENYLHGKVWFESNPETGTVFYLELPPAAQ